MTFRLILRFKKAPFEAVQQGRHVGPVPVGYDRREGLLVPNDRRPAVLRAGQLYASGQYSAAQIADLLNQADYLNADGEPFKVYAVEEMLKNPVYAGFVVLRGEVYAGKHQPIWDSALWSRIQQIQVQRSRRRLRPAVKHEPLLAGLIYCANCGAPMWHFPRDGWRSYRCCVAPSKRPGPIPDIVCKDTWAHAEAVEATTVAWISALALTPDLIERAQAHFQHTHQATVPNLERELRKLKQAFLAERLSAAAYEAQRTALLTGTARLPTPADDSEALVALLRDLPLLLTHTTNAERRTILQQLITEVYTRQKAVVAFRPTRLAERLFQAAAETPAWRDVLTNSGDGGPGGHLAHVPTHRIPYCIPGA